MSAPVYLDANATTPCDRSVVDAMLPYFTEHFGNPSSKVHSYGMRAGAAVDLAREQVAALIGAEPREIVFTSGATESNNLAILGLLDASGATTGQIVTGATEHHAVLDPIASLAARGVGAILLKPGPDGRIDPDAVAAALTPDTRLVSIMAANNEIGAVSDIAALGAVCRERGVLFHTDAAQAVGKLPIDVRTFPVDMLSLTAHKLYGPKGVGALWIRGRGRPRVSVSPRQFGGGQEGGLRSGTLPVPGIVGLGAAAVLAAKDLQSGELDRQRGLCDRLWAGISSLADVQVNGSMTARLPNNLHVSFAGVRAADLILALRHDVACSAGSACSTGSRTPSHVLTALGLPEDLAFSCLRFGISRSTTDADIDRAVIAVKNAVGRLRSSDPIG